MFQIHSASEALVFAHKASCNQINGTVKVDLRRTDYISQEAANTLKEEIQGLKSLGFEVKVYNSSRTIPV